MKKRLFLGASLLIACAFGASASQAPKAASAVPQEYGYYITTCGKVVQGLPASAFDSMEAFMAYAMGINAGACDGESFIPNYSSTDPSKDQPKPNPETPNP